MQRLQTLRFAGALLFGFFLITSGSATAQTDAGPDILLPLIQTAPATISSLVAVDDVYETATGTPLAVTAANGVLANDTPDGPDALQALLAVDVENGTLTLAADGSFLYTPSPNFSGQDRFVYQATDGARMSEPATVTLNVGDGAEAPIARGDRYQVASGTKLVVTTTNGVLANDVSSGQRSLQAVLADDVRHGVLDLAADGSFTYTPDSPFSGEDRFRYRASDGSLMSNIATVTLEVSSSEPINRAPKIVTGVVAFTKQVLDDAADETHSVVAADLDNDGDMDAAATDYLDGAVFWYENNGAGNFIVKTLDADLEGAYPSHVADVDQDGDVDVFAAGYLGDVYAWYRNDGGANFTRVDIDTTVDGPHALITEDLDQDGDVDLLTANQDAGEVAWYENDGANSFAKRMVDDNALGAKRVGAADIDSDGDVDLIAASFDSDEVAWYKNDGSQNFTKFVITEVADGAYYVAAADLDGDGDMDILSASQLNNKIWWYRNDGAENFTTLVVDADSPGARSVLVADVDQDGDVDAIGTSVVYDSVSWYENDGRGNFTERTIDLDADGAYGIFAVDMDYDGDVDVLSAARDAYEVALYTHFRAHSVTVSEGGALTINAGLLQTLDEDNEPAELIYTVMDAPDSGQLRLVNSVLAAGDNVYPSRRQSRCAELCPQRRRQRSRRLFVHGRRRQQ